VVNTLSAPYRAERRGEPVPEGLDEEDFQEEALESEEDASEDCSLVTDEEHNRGGTPDHEEEDM
jgi:hypothetical protein